MGTEIGSRLDNMMRDCCLLLRLQVSDEDQRKFRWGTGIDERGRVCWCKLVERNDDRGFYMAR